jgi:hypothetical protein
VPSPARAPQKRGRIKRPHLLKTQPRYRVALDFALRMMISHLAIPDGFSLKDSYLLEAP